MPVLRSEKLRNGVWIVLWEITEAQADMLPQVILTQQGKAEWESLHHPRKQVEWLAGRLALQALCAAQGLAYTGVDKDAYGKPHLANLPGHISLSHCWPFAAAVYHPVTPIGIDLEATQDKLVRLAAKFLDEKEQEYSGQDLDRLALRWSAKESLYKLHGRKKLIFKEQLKTGVFAPTEYGFFEAKILDEGTQLCQVYFEKITANYWLTVARESVVPADKT